MIISGLINIETTLRVDEFPLAYEPVRFPFFGVNSTVSGVGYNVARALTVLGDEVVFLSLIGGDLAGGQVRLSLAGDGIDDARVLSKLSATAQSVIIYNKTGKRMIFTDLKDIQDQHYPMALFDEALAGARTAVLCNINLNRPFLARANAAGVPIATDVHTIHAVEDHYNSDFMAAADVLFLSDENLPCGPEEFARRLLDRYGARVIVIGLGEDGALLAVREDNFMERVPAVSTRPVVNTIGAGDALFSSFNYYYGRTGSPYEAIQKAVVFASYKIGEAGAAQGFLSAAQLEKLAASI